MRPEPHHPAPTNREPPVAGQGEPSGCGTPPEGTLSREADLRPAGSGVCAAGRSSTEADRVVAALDKAQARPCAFCLTQPRAYGDHYCRRCRTNVNNTRRLAGIEVEK